MSDDDDKREPKAPTPGPFPRMLRAVGSLRIAVTLILLLTLYCLPGVFPAVYDGWLGIRQIEYYGSPLLWILCAAFCVNLLACTLDRLLFRRRGSIGMVLTHASILLLAAGAAWYAFGSAGGELLLYLGEQTDHYYTDAPALHVRWPGTERTDVYPLDGVRDRRPQLANGPITIRRDENGPALEVVDYLPAASLGTSREAHPDAAFDPALLCKLTGPGFPPATAWLRSGAARGDRLAGNGWTLRFHWARDRAALNELTRPRPGGRVIHVRAGDGETLLSATPGSRLWIERLGYLLTVERVEAMTGHGPRATPACVLRIDTPSRSFRRYLLARYPRFSDDEPIPAASRPATDPAAAAPPRLIDTRIVTEYSAGIEQVLLVAGADIDPRLIHHRQDGSVLEAPLKTGEPRTFTVLGRELTVTAAELIERPLTRVVLLDRHGGPEGIPALKIRSPDGASEQWLPRYRFAEQGEPVHIPVDGGLAAVTFSRLRQPLGFRVRLTDFRVETYPGGEVPKDYPARLRLNEDHDATVRLNAPVDFGGLSLYQSSYDGYTDLSGEMAAAAKPWTYSILSVSRKPGLGLIYLGFGGLVLGVLISFFVQPLLRRRRTTAANSEGKPL